MVELAIFGQIYQLFFKTYLFVQVVASLDTNDLSSGLDLVDSLGMVDELLLHGGIVLEMRWLLHTPDESLGR